MNKYLEEMESYVKALNPLLSVYREEDYLVVEHEDYGHVTELHPEDYEDYRELIREGLAHAETPPWDEA